MRWLLWGRRHRKPHVAYEQIMCSTLWHSALDQPMPTLSVRVGHELEDARAVGWDFPDDMWRCAECMKSGLFDRPAPPQD